MDNRFSTEYIEALAHKYRHGTLTPAEEADFEAWYNSHHDDSFVHSDADRPGRAMRRLYGNIHRDVRSPVIRKLRAWLPYAAAVAVLFIVGWLLLDTRHQASGLPGGPAGNGLAATGILPGGNRATLTLADGRSVDLSEVQAGIIAGDEITYLDGSAVLGESAIKGVGGEPHKPTNAHTHMLALTTPKGGTYQITLPDGSKVWLNANSTLKYPSRFSGDSREVILEGEAFFAISHQPSAIGKGMTANSRQPTAGRLPFRVVTRGQTVEVLGTQFNISAYSDDPETKTTLVEGKVKVMPGTEKGSLQKGLLDYVLKPGQQATTRATATQIREVDTAGYIAWKSGKFSFDGKPFTQVMDEVSRWYDLEIIYEGVKPAGQLVGDAFRNQNLSIVLGMLDVLEINYKLDVPERKLTIFGTKGGQQ